MMTQLPACQCIYFSDPFPTITLKGTIHFQRILSEQLNSQYNDAPMNGKDLWRQLELSQQ